MTVGLLAAALMALATVVDAPRVIVQLGHDHHLKGTQLNEEDGHLWLRTLDGEEVVLDLATIMGVTTLIDVETPLEASVHLKRGRVMRGLLLADDFNEVRLEVGGVELRYDRREVARVQLKPDLDALWRHERSLIDDDDEQARLDLAQWLMGHGMWAQAVEELESIVERFKSTTALRLLRQASAQLELQKANDAAPPRDGDESQVDTPEQGGTGPRQLPLPDERVVHLVRLLELDPINPPPVKINADTRRRLHLGWGGTRLLPAGDRGLQTLLAMPDAQVLKLMFDLRARPLYSEIDVLEPPASLSTFNETIHDRWLTTRCGTRSCHGGPDGGRFRLLRRGTVDDRLRTANLLQLERTSIDGRGLIDWKSPGRSLLLLHAMPRDQVAAEDAHPPAPGWRPTIDMQGMEAGMRWIRSMRQPRPNVDWHPVPPPPQAPSPTPPGPTDVEVTPSENTAPQELPEEGPPQEGPPEEAPSR
ncbi:MAG: hypothetical protein MK101_02945 [Phycisphaerales bacterium]|nr:hypothetical protein [Phycisphaerales bacterium]